MMDSCCCSCCWWRVVMRVFASPLVQVLPTILHLGNTSHAQCRGRGRILGWFALFQGRQRHSSPGPCSRIPQVDSLKLCHLQLVQGCHSPPLPWVPLAASTGAVQSLSSGTGRPDRAASTSRFQSARYTTQIHTAHRRSAINLHARACCRNMTCIRSTSS